MKKSRLLIAGSAISLALFSAIPSYAQDAQPDEANAQEEEAEAEEALEEGSGQPILVTGSRIARPTLQSAVPLTSVTIEDLTGTGELSLGDALNDPLHRHRGPQPSRPSRSWYRPYAGSGQRPSSRYIDTRRQRF
jgi:hypothetical protein